MSQNTRETILTVFYIAFGLAGAVLAGYWIVGKVVFGNGSILVRYIVVGLSGALVYAAARLKGLGYCILMIVLMFLGQVALTPPLSAGSALMAALWALPVGVAFTVAGFSFKSLSRVPVGKFLLMALLVGVGYGIGMVAYLWRVRAPIDAAPVLRQLVAGLKVGGLMGVGMELVDLLGLALRPRSEETRF